MHFSDSLIESRLEGSIANLLGLRVTCQTPEFLELPPFSINSLVEFKVKGFPLLEKPP
jgi:hypothetical protein